jgi:hypothetical protein
MRRHDGSMPSCRQCPLCHPDVGEGRHLKSTQLQAGRRLIDLPASPLAGVARGAARIRQRERGSSQLVDERVHGERQHGNVTAAIHDDRRPFRYRNRDVGRLRRVGHAPRTDPGVTRGSDRGCGTRRSERLRW